ncbi:hypothetical protein ACJZ2D_001978 [Fusarium nematophilum]
MATLPEGWEWDYDGTRWFYKYKPNGHIQYHFPKEGDEFPDFVDAGAPIPDLAPEERLESQQQVRRHASTTNNVRASRVSGPNDGGWQSHMSASARPVSAVWEPDNDENEAVFQPENFMYLGPGAYNDVSPLAEEEEEAARRVVAGGIENRVDNNKKNNSPGKGVSPVASERTTPARGQAHAEPLAGEPIMVPATVPEEPAHIIDTREVAHELPVVEPAPPAPDPVGIIAEMPTEDTARARVETNPDPVEMADNMVLAPIETALPMMAELPERSSPVEQKKEEPQHAPGSLRNYGGQPQPQQPPLRVEKKIPEETGNGFQTYKPGAPEVRRTVTPMREEQMLERRMTEEAPMNVKPGQPPHVRPSTTPAVLSPPRVPPKRPLGEPTPPRGPSPQAVAIDAGPVVQIPDQQQGNLSYVPSVLKAGRNAPRRESFPVTTPTSAVQEDAKIAGLAPTQQGDLAHMPSVLKPARGRAPSQPGQQPQFATSSPTAAPGQGHGYKPPKQGQHPPSMTPAPQVQQQRLEEPRMGIQRVNTVPEALPSQRPVSMIQGQGSHMGGQGPVRQEQQPVRPASVMPNMMMGGGGQPMSPLGGGRQEPGYPLHQGMNLPYRGQIESMPSTAPPPPRQAAPFGAPRAQSPPYPEEPLIKPLPGAPAGQRIETSAPAQSNRRHSSFSPTDVSPDSRSGSISSMFPLQTPSPMDNSRRGSSSVSLNQSVNPNYTPSPVSQSSSSMYGFTPTPPSAPANQGQQQGSYFSVQDIEGQGHAVAAQNKLRKKSIGRGPPDTRRSSVGSDQMAAQRGSPLASPPATQNYNVQPQGLSRSQSLHQTSQGPAVSQNQIASAPTPPPQVQQQQQFLGRIEENEEVPSGTVSRSSTLSGSPERTRRSSLASSVQQSPAGSRRTSLHESPGVASAGQFQGRNSPQGQRPQGRYSPQGQVPPQGQMGPQAQFVPQAQVNGPVPIQSPLQGNPTRVQAPMQGPIQPQGQVPLQTQMSAQGQMPPRGPMSPQGQIPQGMPLQQGPMPQGQPLQGQALPPHMPPQNPNQLKRKPSKAQAPAAQVASQGKAPYPGPMPMQTQQPLQIPPQAQGNKAPQGPPTPGPAPAPSPGPARLQKRNSQGPGSPMGQIPTQGVPQGAVRPGQIPPGPFVPQGQAIQGRVQQQQGPMPGQGPMPPGPMRPQGQMAPGQMPPGQMLPPGQAINGRVQPQIQIPQGQQPWPPGMQPPMAQGQRPGSVPPQGVQSAGPKEGKDGKKWFKKWLKATKSVSNSPTTPVSSSPVAPSQRPPPSWGAFSTMPGPKPQALPAATIPAAPAMTPAAAAPLATVSPRIEPRNTPPPEQKPPEGPISTPALANGSQPPAPNPAPQPMAPEPPKSIQQPPPSMESNAPQPVLIHAAKPPPPPAPSPAVSESAPPSMARLASQRRDSLSDAGSITTIEVSEAKPQPVLKPSIVQVNRRSTDMFRRSQDIQRNIELQISEEPTPRGSSEVSRLEPEPPAGQEKSVQVANIQPQPQQNFQAQQPQHPQHVVAQPASAPQPQQPQQPITRPAPAPQDDEPERNLTPAPLFSNPNSPKSVNTSPPAQQPNRFEPEPLFSSSNSSAIAKTGPPPQERSRFDVAPPPAPVTQQQQRPRPPVEDKWAQKPAADYSGGDWGDEDDWDY